MITVLCGLPNAGKTTYSCRFDNVLHMDECGHPQGENCINKAGSLVGDWCIEGVFNSIKSRKRLLKKIANCDKKVCIWIDTPVEICLEREQSYRKRPLDIVMRHAQAFEPPTLEEGWDEIIIVR